MYQASVNYSRNKIMLKELKKVTYEAVSKDLKDKKFALRLVEKALADLFEELEKLSGIDLARKLSSFYEGNTSWWLNCIERCGPYSHSINVNLEGPKLTVTFTVNSGYFWKLFEALLSSVSIDHPLFTPYYRLKAEWIMSIRRLPYDSIGFPILCNELFGCRPDWISLYRNWLEDSILITRTHSEASKVFITEVNY